MVNHVRGQGDTPPLIHHEAHIERDVCHFAGLIGLRISISDLGDLPGLGHTLCSCCVFYITGRVSRLDPVNPPSYIYTITTLPYFCLKSMIWKDVPILLLISMLAYFCFLEQLLVCDMGASRSIVWSLPISSGLALPSTIMASTMVSKSCIWAYATFQFAGVLLFTYIFYTVEYMFLFPNVGLLVIIM
ncbi:unnamed protein product [Cuscuta campestris]|uniref:Uncharacterized protein n=1 Tax=Cuscuta campestris TaxID=132261 RepID=A0A484L298_9ASTE|nr:unnamed protein product [Cuscuta campestris]